MWSSESDRVSLNHNASTSSNDDSTRSGDSIEDGTTSPGNEDPESKESLVDILPRDQEQKTATYDYAYEKSMSHAEAKLFYQHHQLASKSGDSTGPGSPALAGRSLVEFHDDDRAMPTTAADPRYTNQAAAEGSMVHEPECNARSPAHYGTDGTWQVEDSHLADYSARNQAAPLGVMHPQRPYLSAGESFNTPGLGLDTSQRTGFAPSGDAVTSELSSIYRKIRGLLDRRSKYLGLSLQRPEDDPRNQPDWEIYPPPPEPAWDEGKEYQPGNVGGPSDLVGKKRKMGQDIGEDFDMAELMPVPGESSWTYRLDKTSVYQVYQSEAAADRQEPIVKIPSLRDFYMDLDAVVDVSTDGPAKSFAFKRLSYLEGKYQLHTLLNEYQELADSKKVPHRDFYNVRKVDTHVHHSACMNQKHLLRFIKSKMRKSPDEVVLFRDGKHLTLREVFESINLTAYDLSIDTLDMHVSRLPAIVPGCRDHRCCEEPPNADWNLVGTY